MVSRSFLLVAFLDLLIVKARCEITLDVPDLVNSRIPLVRISLALPRTYLEARPGILWADSPGSVFDAVSQQPWKLTL